MWITMTLPEDVRQAVAQIPNGSAPAEAARSVPTQPKPMRGNSPG
jgi:hypothetical protein